jgi:hypothetical protein
MGMRLNLRHDYGSQAGADDPAKCHSGGKAGDADPA